jgi:hypothetical protein
LTGAAVRAGLLRRVDFHLNYEKGQPLVVGDRGEDVGGRELACDVLNFSVTIIA